MPVFAMRVERRGLFGDTDLPWGLLNSRCVWRQPSHRLNKGLVGMNRFIRVMASLAVALSLQTAAAFALAPDPEQSETLEDMIDLLQKRHYLHASYDDFLSSRHLDSYLDALDPQRMYFLASDIETFNQWRLTLDNLGKEGDLNPAFSIFNRFEERLAARLDRILTSLSAEMVSRLDFSRDESILVDQADLPWAETMATLDDRWRKRIKNQVLSLRLAEQTEDEITETLERRYRNLRNRVDQYTAQDVFSVYANALTELYDPHSTYFSPRTAENFDINMSLSFDGIGALLQTDDEYTKVSRLIPAGPAEKQGELKPSDLIIGVGQGTSGPIEDVIGWRIDEVVDLIRGPRETFVRLEVIPGAGKMDERHVITLQRNEVKLEEQSAQSQIITISDPLGVDRRLGVISIPAFYIDFEAYRRGDPEYKSTTRDVRRLLSDLEQADVDGVIIDLRGNGGGSLQEANELTGLFIEFGPTVQIRTTERRVVRDGKRQRSPYYEGPLAVMINRLSASASEIFAGALQDYGRAIIVGDRSFGKGTVQSLIDLPQGQLKVTESKFYRISGGSTQHRGIVPDVTFPSTFSAEQIGESALDNALDWDQIAAVRFPRYTDFTGVVGQLRSRHEQRAATNPDLIFLEDQLALLEGNDSITELPLTIEARQALLDQQEHAALEIENKRRRANGLSPLASLGSGDDDEQIDSDITDSDRNTTEASDPSHDDVLLRETGQILADYLHLKRATAVSAL